MTWLAAHPLILASGSKIRRQLLINAGIPLEAVPADIDERAIAAAAMPASAERIAQLLADRKGRAVAEKLPGRLVLAADQTMSCEGRTYNKPANRAAAREEIASLLGRTHELHAAIALYDDGRPIFAYCETARLTMRDASPGFLEHYLDAVGEGALASVGGYQLEGIGIQLFDKIDGSYFTILGLPLLPLLHFLQSRHYLLT